MCTRASASQSTHRDRQRDALAPAPRTPFETGALAACIGHIDSAARGRARCVSEPMRDDMLGIATMADRDYRSAAQRFARAEPHALQADRLRCWRVLALGLAGDTSGAAALLEQAGPRMQRSAEPAWTPTSATWISKARGAASAASSSDRAGRSRWRRGLRRAWGAPPRRVVVAASPRACTCVCRGSSRAAAWSAATTGWFPGQKIDIVLLSANSAHGFIDFEHPVGVEPRKVERRRRKQQAALALPNRIGSTLDAVVTGVSPRATWSRARSRDGGQAGTRAGRAEGWGCAPRGPARRRPRPRLHRLRPGSAVGGRRRRAPPLAHVESCGPDVSVAHHRLDRPPSRLQRGRPVEDRPGAGAAEGHHHRVAVD